MEYFVRRAGRTICSTGVKYEEEESIPTTTINDCIVSGAANIQWRWADSVCGAGRHHYLTERDSTMSPAKDPIAARRTKWGQLKSFPLTQKSTLATFHRRQPTPICTRSSRGKHTSITLTELRQKYTP